MTLDIAKDVLFVGMGSTSVAHYRCFLPARVLGCDHVGVADVPPQTLWVTGIVKGESKLPNYLDYKVVILQQPRGQAWLGAIRAMQTAGVRVLFEVDDYLHGIERQKDHDYREMFTRKSLREYELCMRACDGLVASTDFIARKYRQFNRNVWVCRNGVDLARYDLKLPRRPQINIGWAGATGHRNAIVPWLKAVAAVMRQRDLVNFVSIGESFAQPFAETFGEKRALSVPFAGMEQYPAAMTHMDIALGPAAHTAFYQGKSDLRWLEAGALGIPIVAHPLVYGDIRDRVTGFLAATPDVVEKTLLELVDDPLLRRHVGDNARRYVRQHRAIDVTAHDWVVAAEEVRALASVNGSRYAGRRDE